MRGARVSRAVPDEGRLAGAARNQGAAETSLRHVGGPMSIAPSSLSTASRRAIALIAVAGLFVVAAFASTTAISAQAPADTGAVYTLTNDPAGNQVLILSRAANGVLTPAGSVATGGRGSGDGL